MKQRFLTKTISVMITVLFGAFLATDLDARGRGGGGGFSRSGLAASGSFSARAAQSGARTASRQAGATQRSGQRTQARADIRTSGQEERTARQGQRQEGRTERTAYRTDAAEDIADDWDRHDRYDDDDNEWGYALAGAAVGATVGYIAGSAAATPTYAPATTYVTVLPCTPHVVVANGINYYQCGSTWYNRAYAGENITYVTVNPPPGY